MLNVPFRLVLKPFSAAYALERTFQAVTKASVPVGEILYCSG